MKTVEQINQTLNSFGIKYSFPVVEAQQGSAAWLKLKLGVISASNASKVVAKRDSDTRLSYMSQLVAQVCTGIADENFSNKYTEWGHQHEDAARAHYEFATNSQLVQVPFVFRDESHREGCSPDSLIPEAKKGVEIKCPFSSEHYVKFLAEDRIKPEYVWQYQYTLRVMNADEWDFVQYDPRMKKNPIKILTVKRDADKQKVFDDMVPAFIEDMDKMLAKIGIKFGEQWSQS